MRNFIVAAELLALGLFATPSTATELAPATRVSILLTTLSYDLNLNSRGDSLRIGVVSLDGNRTSTAHGTETYKAFLKASTKRVKGMSLSAENLNVSDIQGLKALISTSKINVLYLSSHMGSLQSAALRLAGQKKILSLCGEAQAIKAGAAIGVVLRQRKPRILVNLKAAETQGAKLDARLLRLVEVVD